jgi:3,4-dihydroxy 2-butanone 4-phosphate synthase/GTP cyclohydrolase II
MFVPVEEAVREVREGRLLILTDNEERENEGDLICAGAHATPQNVNFMVTHGRGLFCVPLSADVAKRLGLRRPEGNHDPRGTAFTQSVDAIAGNTTGISAYDRANTVAEILRADSRLDDFYSPGHVFPLLEAPGGVLARDGHTEGTLALTRLAGLPPVGVLCEILKDDGTMARVPDLLVYAKRHGLKMCSIAALREYLSHNSQLTDQQ